MSSSRWLVVRWTLLCSLLFGLALPFAAPSPTFAVAGKSLVLVGGGLKDDNAAIYNRIVALAGGPGQARIGIITAASLPESQDPDAGTALANNSRANGEYYANLFKNTYGAADAQWIPIDLDTISNNSSPAVLSQINSMTGFFFGGGDQARLITCLMTATRADSPALAAIRSSFGGGEVVAGSSAGTAIMAGIPMITGGESYDALRYGSYTSPSGDDLSYDPRGGFNLFTYGLLDTHFSERGRQGRIVRLAADRGKTMAYGVDENTALVVTNADSSAVQMEVVGQNGVSVFDLSAATVGAGTYWSISGVKASYLSSGDRYNPLTKTAAIDSRKTALAGREYYSYATSATGDIFSSPNNSTSSGRRNPREFVRVSADLFDSRNSSLTYGRTYETGPRFEVKLTKSSAFGSTGYQGYLNGVNTYSYLNLRVDMYRY
jgi:cyanophycinase